MTPLGLNLCNLLRYYEILDTPSSACVRVCACVRACVRARLRCSPEYILESDFSLGHKTGTVVEGDDVGKLCNGLRETVEQGGPGSLNSFFSGSQIKR